MIAEFKFNGPFLTLAANIGLFVGAVFWGLGCDIWGRRYITLILLYNYSTLDRWSFNLTLLIAGVFGLAAGGSPDFATLASLIAVLGIGVGGNLPVDSAVFLGVLHSLSTAIELTNFPDFIPGSHQYLLTVLAVWFCLGELLASLVRPSHSLTSFPDLH